MTIWNSLVSSITGSEAGPKPPFSPSDFRQPRRVKEGYLWGESFIMPRGCTIRDMSPLTAEIVLWHDDLKPHLLARPLKLFSSLDGKEADCVMASRQGNLISVRFTSALRAPTRRYP